LKDASKEKNGGISVEKTGKTMKNVMSTSDVSNEPGRTLLFKFQRFDDLLIKMRPSSNRYHYIFNINILVADWFMMDYSSDCVVND